MPGNSSSGATTGLVAAVGAVFTALNPWAVTGAAFGCFFFLSASSLLKRGQRVQLLIFSWGVGYAAGEFWSGDGPPYSKEAMLISAAAAALSAVVFTAFYHVIDKGGDMPPWLQSILDRIPSFKNRGDSDGL